MDRRQFLVGICAVGATLSTTVKAAVIAEPVKVPLSKSAIFDLMPTQYPDGRPLGYDPAINPHMMFRIENRSKYFKTQFFEDVKEVSKEECADRWMTQSDPNHPGQMQFTIKSYTSEDKTGIRFDCAKDIDQYYIKNCEFFNNPGFDMKSIAFDDKAMQFAMTSTGNSIAKQTRRGAGNYIILHPDRAQQARDLGYTDHRPFRNIIERDWMAIDEAFVFYKGNSFDQPGILFHNGNLVLPDGFSYGRRVKFKV